MANGTTPQPTSPSNAPPAGYHEVPAPGTGGPPAGYYEVAAPTAQAAPTAPAATPQSNLSPAETRAVESRAGSPLNLGGQGTAGKAQASLYGLQDYLHQKDLSEAAHGEGAGTMTSGYRPVSEFLAGVGGDITGLVGSTGASPKAAALTAASQTPYLRALVLPYLVYQGAKMAAQSRQPSESEPDFLQRILLGGSMAAGAAGSMGKPVANVSKFVNRARSLESINKASVGLLQGKLAPMATKVDALMEQRVAARAQGMEQADAQLQARNPGQPTMIPANLAAAHAGNPSPTFESPKAAALYGESAQAMGGSTFAQMRDLRTRIGRTATALERAGKTNDARQLWDAYRGMSQDMEAHANGPLNMPRQWDAYNKDATAMFDIQKGKMGHLFDTQQYSAQHPAIRIYTKGETPAISLVKELGEESSKPTGEINLWKEHMGKLGLDPTALDTALEQARTLSNAHDSFTGKGQMGGIWRIAMAGGPTAALALGIYGAAHGMGIYGLLPYLMAIGATRGKSSLNARMDAGVTMSELERSLPPEAFRVGRALSDEPLPTTGINVTPPPQPPAPTPPVPTAPAGPAGGGFKGGINPQGTEALTAGKQSTAASQEALVADLQRAAAQGTPEEQAIAKQRLQEMGVEESLPKFGTREELAGKLKGARRARASGVYGGKR